MNAPITAPRSRATLVFHLVLLAWLIGLSALMFVSLRATGTLASQDQLDAARQQQQLLETRLTELTQNVQTIQARPQSATAQALQTTRESLEARMTSVEQAMSDHATANDVAALRTDVEQIKTRQAATRASIETRPREVRPVVTASKETPMAFRVIGAELRGGLRAVLVAPSGSSFADQLQPMLPGESVGPWRLDAIEGQTAVFHFGEQTRRLAIP
jgi:cell division protein FtsB